ncbi:MAG TPA: hypothetical protein VHZ78_05795 [Rhizomicrobium sp.]|nr:hypothetical protein [Rhizomicrobium sp.]
MRIAIIALAFALLAAAVIYGLSPHGNLTIANDGYGALQIYTYAEDATCTDRIRLATVQPDSKTTVKVPDGKAIAITLAQEPPASPCATTLGFTIGEDKPVTLHSGPHCVVTLMLADFKPNTPIGKKATLPATSPHGPFCDRSS